MISIIIPTYNRADKLLSSLDSVINQTYKDIEIIVVDDGSIDSTESVIQSVNDDRVKFIKHKINKGGCAARNTGIENAKGEYIAFQDSDDAWYNNKLEVELESLLTNNADVVFCKMNRIIDGQSTKVVPADYKEGFLNPVNNVFGIGTPTVLGKATVFKNNRFDEDLPRFQELELLLRISKSNSIYCCDKVLMDTFLDNSPSATSGNPQKLLKASEIIHMKYPKLKKDFKETSRRISNILFSQSFRTDVNKKQKRRMWKLAVGINPTIKTILKYILIRIGLYSVIFRNK